VQNFNPRHIAPMPTQMAIKIEAMSDVVNKSLHSKTDIELERKNLFAAFFNRA